VKDIAANGEDGVTITVSRPDFFLLPALNELMLTHPDNEDLATGPFSLASRTPIVEARRFRDYHGGQTALSAIRIQTFDTQRSAWAALMRGEVDVVQEVARDSVEFMQRSSNIATYPTVQPFYLALVFNHRHPTLAKVEVRRALAEAIDKRGVIDRAMRGKGRLAADPIWPFHWAYPQSAPRREYDPTIASSRLDTAGFPFPRNARKDQPRSRLSFRCMVYNEDPQFERMALLIQRNLFDIGVVMDIELVDLNTLVARASKSEYDALLIQMHSGRTMDYMYRFWRSEASEAKMVNSGYTGVDTLLEDLRRSLTDQETAQTVNNLVNRFHEDVPAVFLAWTEVTRAVDKRFDVGEATGQDPFFNIWQWRVREETSAR
jgi:ABC-type transport system substrate-binding protein